MSAKKLWSACAQAFRPEFLNRLDEIILFHRLSLDNMDTIVDIQLETLAQASGLTAI